MTTTIDSNRISPEELARIVQPLVDAVQNLLHQRRSPPLATYRLQFHSKFTFADATAIIPYLHELGVSHVYASPYLRARRGSMHGYDVCSHEELNPELGTEADFEQFVSTLRKFGMRHILDIVPNHMAASSENPWWYDVLQNGPNSPYSTYFDIDWHPAKVELANRVLLPYLGEQYGEALESGNLKLEYVDGAFQFRYFSNVFAVGPKTVLPILEHRLPELATQLGETSDEFVEYQSILTALQHLPPQTAVEPQYVTERQREKEVIKRRLRDLQQRCAPVGEFIAQNVSEFNGRPGDPSSFDRLDELVRAQAYRLSHWKAAADEINYRRFFDINELAAICMEQEEVFQRAHRLVMSLLVQDKVHGVRIDHVDGLYDPTQYLWRLQWAYLEQLGAAQFASAHPTPNDGQPEWSAVRGLYMQQICRRIGLQAPTDTASAVAAGSTDNQSHASAPAVDPREVTYARIAGARNIPLYVLIEKILGADEPLPTEWPVAGTSGYDFLAQLNGLFVEPQGLESLVTTYHRFLGFERNFSDEVHRCKLLILRVSMSSELQMLAHRLNRISEQHRRTRDFTLNSLRHALREILACFPVYRTYPMPSGISDRDRRFTNLAVAHAKRRNPAIDSAIFDFVRKVLLFEHPPGLDENAIREREKFTGRFQQVTSPVMAKGVEDTTFYVVCPLLSINEVGSHPPHAVVSVDQFHKENSDRRRMFPDAMLATSTHDTKRSEDVRARMNVLTELPNQWRKAVNRWARLNRRYLAEVDGEPAPSRNDEYVFYQTLLGVWPATEVSDEEHAGLIERLQQYMEKATHEAKTRTSWINPNQPYDAAMRDFVAKTLERRKDNRFLREFAGFVEPIVRWGWWTALSQTTLKLMSPGVPDIYYGQEIWNLSLVDPDNRRPVDFGQIQRQFDELRKERQDPGPEALCERLLGNPHDPGNKLYVTWQAMHLRKAREDLFIDGDYVPLAVQGPKSAHVVAFAWIPADRSSTAAANSRSPLIVAAPRHIAKFDLERSDRDATSYPHSSAAWADTAIQVHGLGSHELEHVFTGTKHRIDGEYLPVADIFSKFPVAVLA